MKGDVFGTFWERERKEEKEGKRKGMCGRRWLAGREQAGRFKIRTTVQEEDFQLGKCGDRRSE